jgi:hypothetical protein
MQANAPVMFKPLASMASAEGMGQSRAAVQAVFSAPVLRWLTKDESVHSTEEAFMSNASLILTAIAIVVFTGFWHGFARAEQAPQFSSSHVELVQG